MLLQHNNIIMQVSTGEEGDHQVGGGGGGRVRGDEGVGMSSMRKGRWIYGENEG